MHRRPWPLVALAVFFLVSPVLYPLTVAIVFGVPFLSALQEQLQTNSPLRNIETFLLPLVMAWATYFARRPAYFIVLFGSLYLMGRAAFIFFSGEETSPAVALLITLASFGIALFYFSRRETREIFFNEKMRWWETDPRYRVDWPARISRHTGVNAEAKILNIAVGGASIEGSLPHLTIREKIFVEFTHHGTQFRMAAAVIWEKPETTASPSVFGAQWIDEPQTTSFGKIRALIRDLKSSGVPKTGDSERTK